MEIPCGALIPLSTCLLDVRTVLHCLFHWAKEHHAEYRKIFQLGLLLFGFKTKCFHFSRVVNVTFLNISNDHNYLLFC